MLPLHLHRPEGRPLVVAALGAHADDLEIGAGGTLHQLASGSDPAEVHVLVLSGTAERAAEVRTSAQALLGDALASCRVLDLPDGRFPGSWTAVKDAVEALAARVTPDLVLGPRRRDAHQDHRVLAEVVPTVFRSALLLGYEIPKRDGERERADLSVALTADDVERKWQHLLAAFPSQASRVWFDREVFVGLARLRGLESGTTYAEGFTCPAVSLHLR